MHEPRFALGQIVATPAALEVLHEVGLAPTSLIQRHVTGDWGDLDEHDRKENEHSVNERLRVFSVYKVRPGQKVYVITEADRSSTCVLLPSDF